MIKIFKNILIATLSLSPVMAFAGDGRLSGIKGLIQAVGGLINPLIAIVIGIALLSFFWGLVKFIFRVGGGDENAVKNGKQLMIWGLIALFVMIAFGGIIKFMEANLFPSGNTAPPIELPNPFVA